MSSPSGFDTATLVADDGPPSSYDAEPSAASKSDIKPSVAWYWIGAGILVIGLCVSFALMISGIVTIADAPNRYERVSVPGERSLTFTESGTFHLYGETPDYRYNYGTSGSYGLDTNTIIRPMVVVKASDGSAIPVVLSTRPSSSSYSTNGLDGYDFATVFIPSAGAYTVTVNPGDSKDTGPFPPSGSRYGSLYATYGVSRVAVGNATPSSAIIQLVASALTGSIAVLLGLLVLVVAAVKRTRSRKILFPPKLRPAPYGSFGPGYQAAGPRYPGSGGYPQPNYAPPGYPPPGYPAPGYPAPGYPAPGYGPPRSGPGPYPGPASPWPSPPPRYAAPGYAAPGYAAAGYPVPGYPPPGSAPGSPSSGPPIGAPVAGPFEAVRPSSSGQERTGSEPTGPAPVAFGGDAIDHVEPPVSAIPSYLDPPTSTTPPAHPLTDRTSGDNKFGDAFGDESGDSSDG